MRTRMRPVGRYADELAEMQRSTVGVPPQRVAPVHEAKLSPKLQATRQLMRGVDALLTQSTSTLFSKSLSETGVGFVKPNSVRVVGNEIQAKTWKGYAISVVVVVDRVKS